MESARIEQEAADWLARRDGGSWTDADALAFEEWQNRSTANRIAVIRLGAVWQRADRLQALGAGVSSGEIPAPGSWLLSAERCRDLTGRKRANGPPTQKRALGSAHAASDSPIFQGRSTAKVSSIPRLRTWAAVLVLGLSAAVAGYFFASSRNTFRSTIGEIRVVSLSDGSKITLNTNSVIRVRYSRKERLIDLERGEAYFEDVEDPSRPFIVSAAGRHIVAVGTKFDVYRHAMETRVVVTNGQVNVESSGGGNLTGGAAELPAGSVAQVSLGTVLVKHISLGEAQDYVAWRTGYLRFHGTALATAVQELNRYNTTQLVISDPAIANLKIAGNVRATNVAAFVQALEEGFPVRVSKQGQRIVLSAKVSQ